MKKFFLTPLLALLAMTVPAMASFHSAPIVDTIAVAMPFVPEWLALAYGLAIDNLLHAVTHIAITLQMLLEVGPIMVAKLLEGACFSAVPPWSHVLFSTGLAAVVTSLAVSTVLLLSALYAAFRLTRTARSRMSWPDRRAHLQA
jgi:hypothetical protein